MRQAARGQSQRIEQARIYPVTAVVSTLPGTSGRTTEKCSSAKTAKEPQADEHRRTKSLPADWRAQEQRWDKYQWLRAISLIAAFAILVCGLRHPRLQPSPSSPAAFASPSFLLTKRLSTPRPTHLTSKPRQIIEIKSSKSWRTERGSFGKLRIGHKKSGVDRRRKPSFLMHVTLAVTPRVEEHRFISLRAARKSFAMRYLQGSRPE